MQKSYKCTIRIAATSCEGAGSVESVLEERVNIVWKHIWKYEYSMESDNNY